VVGFLTPFKVKCFGEHEWVAINLTGLGEDDRFIGVEIVIPAEGFS